MKEINVNKNVYDALIYSKKDLIGSNINNSEINLLKNSIVADNKIDSNEIALLDALKNKESIIIKCGTKEAKINPKEIDFDFSLKNISEKIHVGSAYLDKNTGNLVNLTSNVAKKFIELFDKLDLNKGGIFSKNEMLNKIQDPNLTKEEGALLRSLTRNFDSISKLDNGFIDKHFSSEGISIQDIIEYDKIPNDQWIKKNAEENYSYSISNINSIDNNKNFGDKIPTKKEDIDFKNIKQGNMGDCFFLTALAPIAKNNPQKIFDMIKENKDGTYTVNFYDNGKKTPIQVSPLNNYDKSFIATDKLWVGIIEKAYSKFVDQIKGDKNFLDYNSIDAGGTISEALSQISGNKSESVDITEKIDLKNIIKTSLDNKKGICIGGSPKSDLNIGVLQGHAYAILDYRIGKNNEMFVTIRNPWGSSPTGNTLDKDNNGIFELPFKTIQKTFGRIHYEK